ncbi:AMP-binding protein [Streptomyces bambusae]|uniref:AMP-binding protein n=1 Tax=Streptomyces bambusae TaxID=1550616 RepID=UPI001CFFDF66|nr:AMP-binding protein [Streptomyces bambusae]MCB5170086.1 AMP-binding protein [Streptomyces bambusae]
MAATTDGGTPWPEAFADRYWAAGHWRGATLDELLRGWCLAYGPRTALVHGADRLTYAQLNRRVDRLAAGFRLRGIQAGARVVVQLPDVPEFVTVVFALVRAGAVPVLLPGPVPLPGRAPAEVLPPVVTATQAVGYVGPAAYGGAELRPVLEGIAAHEPFLRRVFTYEPPGSASPYGGVSTDPAGCHYFPLDTVDSPPGPAPVRSAGRVAFLLPSDDGQRLVPRTHNDFAHQVRAAAEASGLTGEDVYLAASPAASVFALGCPGIVGALSVGATVVLPGDAGGGEGTAGALPAGAERVTVVALGAGDVPGWLDADPAGRAGADGPRLVQVGGTGPLDRATAERVGGVLQQVFALPEGPVTLTRPGDPAEVALTTRGRPLTCDDELRVVGPDGTDAPVDEPGELLARGPATVRGYYRGAGAEAFTSDGWLRTGVRARITGAGNLVPVGGPTPDRP